MHIVIRATQQQREEWIQKGSNPSVTVEWLTKNEDFSNKKADAFFDLTFNDENIKAGKLESDTIVFANAVSCTCTEIGRKNYVRLNAWTGFLNRSIIELAFCDEAYKQKAIAVLNALNWNFILVPDDYGLIAARIIAMIINEAYYALQEKVSTKEQIDSAMKLGTNYPYGPFEWSERIGLNNIYNLLQKLSKKNNRYTIAEMLRQAAHQNIL